MTHRWEHWVVSEIWLIGHIVAVCVPAGPVLRPAVVDCHHKLCAFPDIFWQTGVCLWWNVLGANLTHLRFRVTLYSWQKEWLNFLVDTSKFEFFDGHTYEADAR